MLPLSIRLLFDVIVGDAAVRPNLRLVLVTLRLLRLLVDLSLLVM